MPSIFRRLALALAGLALLSLPAQAQESKPALSLDDVFALEYANDPQLLPDGSAVIYLRTRMDRRTDRRHATIWTVATDTRTHTPLLTEGSYSNLALSPDGSRLAYVTGGEDGAEIHVLWLDSMRRAQITQLDSGPSALSWSPDGTMIAFTMAVEGKDDPLPVKLPKPPEGSDWAEKPLVIDRMVYRRDGRGIIPVAFNHVFVVPADGGTPRQVTSGDFNHSGSAAWLPGGDALIVSANRRADWDREPQDTDLWRVDLTSLEMTRLTERFGPDSQPAVSPDGRFLAYTGYDDKRMGFHTRKLYLRDLKSGDTQVLADDLDRSLSGPVWDPKGRGLYVRYTDRGDTKLAFITTGDRREILAQGLGGLSLGRPYGGTAFSVAENGAFAALVTGADHPADIAFAQRRGGEMQRLTALNADLLDHRKLGKVEEILTTSSAGGLEIQSWIVYPPDFDPQKSYPLILEIHGGPFADYGPRFAMELQLMAAEGYVVLYSNPRGSTSYGAAFANEIHHNYPGQDYDDLMSAVDAVLAKGFIDEERLFVTGGSGGGVLTAWIVGKTDRFRAAVVAKPVINWQSFVLTADSANFFYRYWFPGTPWDEPEHYWARSPLSLVGNVRTPTMLLTGEADYRTPMPETEQYYQALKIAGVETAMVRLPGASHGIAARPSQLAAKVAYILAWFEKYDDQDAE